MSADRHALLSASGASRWLNCTPSARLEEQFPDTTSEYAEEGSLAHELAELTLKKTFTSELTTRKYNSEVKKIKSDKLFTEDMPTHIEKYFDAVSKLFYSFETTPYIAIERELDLSAYAPESFGTSDCIIIGAKTLIVIDFKYGRGVEVSAENNPQMRLYALGAYEAYKAFYGIETVKTVIIQPRLNNESAEELSLQELLDWGDTIKPKANQAFMGLGEQSPGVHCRFCKAKAVCRARADGYTELEEFGSKEPKLLSNEEIGDILRRGELIENWLSDVKDYALAQTLEGNDIEGWKAVEGRSIRTFDSIDEVFDILLKNGYDESLLYKRNPITLTELEKLVKKDFELISDHIVKPKGKPTLVKANDKREAITRISASDDFN